MKKYIIGFLAAVFVLGLCAHCASAASDKVSFATVDIGKVFDEYEKTKQYDLQFQKEESEKQKERDKFVNEIRRLRDEQMVSSDDARAEKQKGIDAQISQLDQFDRETKEMLKEKRNTAVREVFNDIEGTMQQYGERKGFDFILNDRAVLYRPDSKDVTQDVLNELNGHYAKTNKK